VNAIAVVLAAAVIGAGGGPDTGHLKRTRVLGYEQLHRPRVIRIIWLTNSAFGVVRVRVREGRRRVVVTVIERVPGGNYTMVGEQRVRTLKLNRPLGSRALIDGATGRRVP
jgi:hypothetical protein